VQSHRKSTTQSSPHTNNYTVVCGIRPCHLKTRQSHDSAIQPKCRIYAQYRANNARTDAIALSSFPKTMLSKAAPVIVQAQGSADVTAKRPQAAKVGVPFAKHILPVSTTATPKHVRLNMAGGWKKPIPMTDVR
jgi:hypothetical protein